LPPVQPPVQFIDSVHESYDKVVKQGQKKDQKLHDKKCQDNLSNHQAQQKRQKQQKNHRNQNLSSPARNKEIIEAEHAQNEDIRMNNPQQQGRDLNHLLKPDKRIIEPVSLQKLSKQKKQKINKTTLNLNEHSNVINRIKENIQTRSKTDICDEVTQIGYLIDKLPQSSKNSSLRGDLQRRVKNLLQDLIQ